MRDFLRRQRFKRMMYTYVVPTLFGAAFGAVAIALLPR
jgi:hypothetical protein